MRIRTPGDLIATVIAWSPILAFFTLIVWVVCVALMSFEARTSGSEYFVTQAEAPNVAAMPGGAGASLDDLLN